MPGNCTVNEINMLLKVNEPKTAIGPKFQIRECTTDVSTADAYLINSDKMTPAMTLVNDTLMGVGKMTNSTNIMQSLLSQMGLVKPPPSKTNQASPSPSPSPSPPPPPATTTDGPVTKTSAITPSSNKPALVRPSSVIPTMTLSVGQSNLPSNAPKTSGSPMKDQGNKKTSSIIDSLHFKTPSDDKITSLKEFFKTAKQDNPPATNSKEKASKPKESVAKPDIKPEDESKSSVFKLGDLFHSKPQQQDLVKSTESPSTKMVNSPKQTVTEPPKTSTTLPPKVILPQNDLAKSTTPKPPNDETNFMTKFFG